MGAEVLGAVGVLRGEVCFFSGVGGKVEQLHAVVLDPVDEFPVADAHAAARAAAVVAIVRKVPEEGLLLVISFFNPSAPFPPKARGRWGFGAHCASRIGLARNARRGMHSERHDSGAPPRFWHRAKRRHQMPSQAAKITSAKGAANVTEFSTKRRTRSPPPRNSPRL